MEIAPDFHARSPSASGNVYDIFIGCIHNTHPDALVDGELDPSREPCSIKRRRLDA
jgi:hypothetical protein